MRSPNFLDKGLPDGPGPVIADERDKIMVLADDRSAQNANLWSLVAVLGENDLILGRTNHLRPGNFLYPVLFAV